MKFKIISKKEYDDWKAIKKDKKVLTKRGYNGKILAQQSGMVRSHLNGLVRAVNIQWRFSVLYYVIFARMGYVPSVL